MEDKKKNLDTKSETSQFVGVVILPFKALRKSLFWAPWHHMTGTEIVIPLFGHYVKCQIVLDVLVMFLLSFSFYKFTTDQFYLLLFRLDFAMLFTKCTHTLQCLIQIILSKSLSPSLVWLLGFQVIMQREISAGAVHHCLSLTTLDRNILCSRLIALQIQPQLCPKSLNSREMKWPAGKAPALCHCSPVSCFRFTSKN